MMPKRQQLQRFQWDGYSAGGTFEMSSPGLQLLTSQLDAARAQTDALFSLLDPAALYHRPVADRHRLIFYLGHVEAFDWNLLSGRAFQKPSFHPDFDKLFAFGIDPEPGREPSDLPADWPSEAEVRGYCSRVRRELDEALAKSGDNHQDQLLNVAVEHRMMHAETLAYLFHNLPYESKHVGPAGRLVLNTANDNSLVGNPVNPMMDIPAGLAELGRRSGNGFGWDNEFEAHSVEVPAFRISRFKISNGEYLAYLRATGAEPQNNGTATVPNGTATVPNGTATVRERQHPPQPTGTATVRERQHPPQPTGTATVRERQHPPQPTERQHAPHFWIKRDTRWFLRAMFGEIPLPLDWPVYVTHREASEYIRWRSGMEYRNFALPTETQFHRVSEGAAPVNANFERWDPVPVDVGASGAGGESKHGVAQTIGNGWEWTSTVFAPFPGFEPFPFYPGYSADFFDGKHFVMKGGSPRTARALLRPSFRNWFRADYPYVYAGFRVVENVVENDRIVATSTEKVIENVL
jgi:formylglycine-generating enzyme required for sulfatase activity